MTDWGPDSFRIGGMFSKGSMKFIEEESGNRCPKVKWLLTHTVFRLSMNCIILINAIQLGLSVDMKDAGWKDVWRACEHAFAAFFAIEMVMMVSVLRTKYFKDNWLLLDFVVAVVSILDAWVFPIVSIDYDVGFFRHFRLFRLLRILKLAKVVPELAVVVEGLFNSMKSLLWVFVLMGVFLYAGAICCVEVLGHHEAGYPSYSEDQSDINVELVQDFNNYIYYGSVYRSMITLFGMVLLSEWPLVRPVAELHSAMVPFFILFICVVAFGVLNVIIGIVVDKTMEAMQEVRDEAVEIEYQERVIAAEQMAELMFDIDTDGDGRISNEELEASLKNEKMRMYLKRLDLPHKFSSIEFIHMLDVDGNGSLSKNEFEEGLFRLLFCTEFQRDCLHQMSVGALHNSMHRLTQDLKKDVLQAVNEISREVRMVLTGPWEPLKPGFGVSPHQVRFSEKPVGAVSPDLSAQASPNKANQAATFQACPQKPDYKVLDIHTRTIQTSWETLRAASGDVTQSSCPNPPFDTSRFYNAQLNFLPPEGAVMPDLMGNGLLSYPPNVQALRRANVCTDPNEVYNVSC